MGRRLSLVLFLFMVGYGTESRATIVLQMSLEELAGRSDAVVHGLAERSWSAWDDERGKIYTYTLVRVDDSLKGPWRERIVVKELGGTVGDMTMTVGGAPEFQPGEEVVLFLVLDRQGDFRTLGFTQGKFEVQTEGGQKVVVRRTEGATIVTPDGLPARLEPRVQTLAEFLSWVRVLASRVRR
ncbi:MAG: hypothetical protein HY652_01160 [Acidobacteria bacterium]|nr:hypothetical protein [Acidobacteriota bacterium]